MWLTVHQLGYAWRYQRLQSTAWNLGWFFIGLGTLLALVFLEPYPLNFERPARRWLASIFPWTGTG